eukprot:g2578.t1
MHPNPSSNALPTLSPLESPLQVSTTNPITGVEKKLTSRYRGVCWNRKNRRWQAAINRAGQYIYLGSFVSEVDAAKAFDRAAVKLRGHSTKINFDFEDYKDELKWHEQTYRADGATEAILKDPKILRGKTDNPGYTLPMQNTTGARRQQFTQQFGDTIVPHHMDPNGFTQVFTQQQTQRLTMSVPFQNYMQPVPQMMSFSASGRLPPHVGPSSSSALFPAMPMGSMEFNPAHAKPAGFSSLTASQQSVNFSIGGPANQTQFFPGAGNAFALAYARNTAPGISVLVFDGQVMSDNGVFSTMEDAAQACKSLLNIIGKMHNHSKTSLSSSTKLNAPIHTPMPAHVHARAPTDVPMNPIMSQKNNVALADNLSDRSPFEIRPGCTPDCVRTNNEQKWISHDTERVSGMCCKSLNPGTHMTSIQAQMGSLLNMSNNQFESLTKGAGSVGSIPVSVQAGEKPPEASMRLSTASVSLLSRSLEDLVSVLSQSGSIKREGGDEGHENGISALNSSSIDLRVEEKSLTLNGPTMRIPTLVYEIQTGAQEAVAHGQNAGQHAFLAKRKMDPVQENEISKKHREV